MHYEVVLVTTYTLFRKCTYRCVFICGFGFRTPRHKQSKPITLIDCIIAQTTCLYPIYLTSQVKATEVYTTTYQSMSMR